MEGYRIKCPECGSVLVDANINVMKDGSEDQDPTCRRCECPLGDEWSEISEEEYWKRFDIQNGIDLTIYNLRGIQHGLTSEEFLTCDERIEYLKELWDNRVWADIARAYRALEREKLRNLEENIDE